MKQTATIRTCFKDELKLRVDWLIKDLVEAETHKTVLNELYAAYQKYKTHVDLHGPFFVATWQSHWHALIDCLHRVLDKRSKTNSIHELIEFALAHPKTLPDSDRIHEALKQSKTKLTDLKNEQERFCALRNNYYAHRSMGAIRGDLRIAAKSQTSRLEMAKLLEAAKTVTEQILILFEDKEIAWPDFQRELNFNNFMQALARGNRNDPRLGQLFDKGVLKE